MFWQASGPNADNVYTELLLQRLKPGQWKAYEGKYLTADFVTFDSFGLTDQIFVPSGQYATVYRFVNSLTGQASPLMPLNIVSVS